jgi:hypothetical protein
MSTTTPKQIRLSQEGMFLLKTCREDTGFTDTKIMELCLALHALHLGREVRRAHEALYDNLVHHGDAKKLASHYRDSLHSRSKRQPET